MKLQFYTKLFFMIILVQCTAAAYAQIDPPCTIPGAYLCDNLDAYTSGDALGPGASWWSTWSGTEGGSEDGEISTDYAYSGTNSALIPEGGTTDALLLLGNQSTGVWRLEWQMYVPSGKIAYYNMQEDESPGVAWNLELYFGDATEGTGQFTVPAGGPSFTYPVDQWFTVRHIIDLDADIINVYIDGVNVLSDSYTGNIGSIDFYSAGGTLNRCYLDDVLMMEITGEGCVLGTADLCDNIETYTAGETIGAYADWWSTWSGTEGGAEDGIVSDEQAYSGINSMRVSEGGTNDVLLKLGNLASGSYNVAWQMYLPNDKTGYYNIQEDEDSPGAGYNLELLFALSDYTTPSSSGEGVISVPDEGVTFTYPVGQWFSVEHIIDLDAGTIDLYIDGELIYSSDYAGTQIGAIDFYSIDANCRYYIDDVLLEESAGIVSTYYADLDDDTYGNVASSIEVVGSAPDGYVSDATDCDDTNAAVHPGATEVCNTIDDDCDTDIDEGVLITFYADADEDTYGDAGTTEAACDAPTGYVSDDTDCDDTNAAVNPGATEITNSIDDDCDGLTDENVAIQEVNGNTATINIYPVPNDGNFTLTVTSYEYIGETLLLEIYSASGERLYDQKLFANSAETVHEIFMNNYAAGFYILKLTQGDALFVKQFVVE